MAFKRLVRFEHKGEISYGDLLDEKNGLFTVKKLRGDILTGFSDVIEQAIEVNQVGNSAQ